MYLCMYVCMYACAMHVCMYACMCACVRVYVCMQAYQASIYSMSHMIYITLNISYVRDHDSISLQFKHLTHILHF